MRQQLSESGQAGLAHQRNSPNTLATAELHGYVVAVAIRESAYEVAAELHETIRRAVMSGHLRWRTAIIPLGTRNIRICMRALNLQFDL